MSAHDGLPCSCPTAFAGIAGSCPAAGGQPTFNCLCCLLPPSLTLPHVLLTMACLLGPLQRSFVACAIGRASCLSSGCGSPVPLLPLLLRRPPLTTLASSPLAALSKPMATMRSCAPPLVQIPFVWLIARSGLPNRST